MIHSTAIIDRHAELDSTVEVGPFCVIGPQVKIKKGTQLHSHVVISGDTTIGEDNVFHPYSVIGGEPQDLKYKGEKTKLIIGNRNKIRECATLNTGTVDGGNITQLGDDNLIMAYVHFGHDVIIGNHCILANSVQLAGHVILEDYVTLNGQTAVQQFVKIGAHSYIGGQSGVERDVPPFLIAHGQRPCSIKGANIVGLRRRGFSAERISKINEAIKLWTRSDVEKQQCLLDIESQYGELSEIKEFIEFIRDSKNGAMR